MSNITFDSAARIGGGLSPSRDVRGAPFPHALVLEDLGTPAAAAANNIATTQSVTASVAANLNGSLVSSGVATLDVPRNVVAAWTNTAVITVTGHDKYGQLMIERSASGTSFTGKKAFKTVTAVTFSADVTGATVGTGTVLGLSNRCAAGGFVQAKLNDNTAETGTAVVGDATAASATTGDVRGTYAPSGTLNGSNRVRVLYAVKHGPDTADAFGVSQYAG